MPVLTVRRNSNGEVPYDWCLPNWYETAERWHADYGKTFLRTGCGFAKEGCPIKPEKLREMTESMLAKMPEWGMRPLSLEVYSLARNIQSEYGKGSATERACIFFTAVNRALKDKVSIVKSLVSYKTGLYGGNDEERTASTTQDPSLSNVLLADFLWRGVADGTVSDISNGAIAYYDPYSQNGLALRYGNGRDAKYIYESWSAGGNYLTWVGHIPGVRPGNLMLFTTRYDLRPTSEDSSEEKARKMAERAGIINAGRRAALGSNAPPPAWESCAFAYVVQASRYARDIVAELPLMGPGDAEEADRDAWSAAALGIGLGALAGLGAGLLQSARMRQAVVRR